MPVHDPQTELESDIVNNPAYVLHYGFGTPEATRVWPVSSNNFQIIITDENGNSRRYLPSDRIAGCSWSIERYGGYGDFSIDAYAALTEFQNIGPTDRVEFWFKRKSDGAFVRFFRGYIYDRRGQVNDPKQLNLVGFGRFHSVGKFLINKRYTYAVPTDIRTPFERIAQDYIFTKLIYGEPALDLSTVEIGGKVDMLEYHAKMVQDAYRNLTEHASNKAIWGVDVNDNPAAPSPSLTAADRLYLRLVGELNAPDHVLVIPSQNIGPGESPYESSGVVNRIFIQGGQSKYPNRLFNPSFEKPIIAGEWTSILKSPGFEDRSNWNLFNGASYKQTGGSEGAAHGGEHMIETDNANEYFSQTATNSQTLRVIQPGNTYVFGGFARREQGATPSEGFLRLVFIDTAGATVATEQYNFNAISVWDRYELMFTAPTNADGFRVEAGRAGSGSIVWDDMFLYDVSRLAQEGWALTATGSGRVMGVNWAVENTVNDQWETPGGSHSMLVFADAQDNTTNNVTLAPANNDRFEVQPNEQIRFTAWMRHRGDTLNPSPKLLMVLQDYNKDNQKVGTPTITTIAAGALPTSGSWTVQYATHTCDANAASTLAAIVFCGTGQVQFDAFSVRNAAADINEYVDATGLKAYLTARYIYDPGEAPQEVIDSETLYGIQEEIETQDSITSLKDAVEYAKAYFLHAALPVRRPVIEAYNDPTVYWPGQTVRAVGKDGGNLLPSDSTNPTGALHIARVRGSWSANGIMTQALELSTERPDASSVIWDMIRRENKRNGAGGTSGANNPSMSSYGQPGGSTSGSGGGYWGTSPRTSTDPTLHDDFRTGPHVADTERNKWDSRADEVLNARTRTANANFTGTIFADLKTHINEIWTRLNWTDLPGKANASATVKGITRLSVAPADANEPIAVGVNDPAYLNSNTTWDMTLLAGPTAARAANMANNVPINFLGVSDVNAGSVYTDLNNRFVVRNNHATGEAYYGTLGNSAAYIQTNGINRLIVHTNGSVTISGTAPLELGYEVVGKQADAGKIGYGTFTADALDIVGAGTTGANRRIKLWAEGGLTLNGPASIEGSLTTTGNASVGGTLAVTGTITSNGQVFGNNTGSGFVARNGGSTATNISPISLLSWVDAVFVGSGMYMKPDQTWTYIGGYQQLIRINNDGFYWYAYDAGVVVVNSRQLWDKQGVWRWGVNTTQPISTGNVNITGTLTTTANATLRNAVIGDVGHGASFAGFAHSSVANPTQYALLSQDTGNTYLNAGTGAAINFRIANSNVGFWNAAGLTVYTAATLSSTLAVTGNISTTARIGIGTSSPDSLLHVYGTTAPGTSIHVQGAGGTNVGGYLQVTGNYETWANLLTNNNNVGAKFVRFGNFQNLFRVDRLSDDGTAIAQAGLWAIDIATGKMGVRTGADTPAGALEVRTGGNTGGWDKLIVTTTQEWNGANDYVTLGSGGAEGIMLSNPYITWRNGRATLCMGQVGSVSTGAYWDAGLLSGDAWGVSRNGDQANPLLYVLANGKTGVGNSNPLWKMTIGSGIHSAIDNNISLLALTNMAIGDADGRALFLRVNKDNPLAPYVELGSYHYAAATWQHIVLGRDGSTTNIGIGDNNPTSFRLQVKGDIGPSISGTYNLGSSSLPFATIYANSATFSATIGFGSRLGQHINLYSTGYGIGIQNSTAYIRTDGEFSVHLGGGHSDTTADPGFGGTNLLRLSNTLFTYKGQTLYHSGNLPQFTLVAQARNDAGSLVGSGSSGFYYTNTPTNYPTGASSWWHLLDVRHNNGGDNFAMQIAGSYYDQKLWYRKTNNAATTVWSQIWSSSNQGAGSTMDADKLDGQEGTHYTEAGAYVVMAGNVTPVPGTEHTFVFRVPRGFRNRESITWTFVDLAVTYQTPPATGESPGINIRKNGIAILTADLTVAGPAKTAETGTFNVTTCVSGDELVVYFSNATSVADRCHIFLTMRANI